MFLHAFPSIWKHFFICSSLKDIIKAEIKKKGVKETTEIETKQEKNCFWDKWLLKKTFSCLRILDTGHSCLIHYIELDCKCFKLKRNTFLTSMY